MEMNRNIVQEQPAQTILPASVQSENARGESQITTVSPELPLPSDTVKR